MGRLTLPAPCSIRHRRPWRRCVRARTSRTKADADDDVKYMRWRQREGPTHQRRRSHVLSARDDSRQGEKQKPTRFAAMGGLTRSSPCSNGHRRPWCNCVRTRRYAHTKAEADAGPDSPAAAHAHPQCPRRQSLWRKTKLITLRDLPSARDVGFATADRGVTAPAHAGMHAHRQT
jgi:hypothetical protein